MAELATSTIAMSIYNLLTLSSEPPTAGQLYNVLCTRVHETEVPRDQFVAALKALLLKKYVAIVHKFVDGKPVNVDQDHFRCVDPLRRRVRWRDRTGEGWNDWKVEDPRGPQLLEEVINGIQ